MLGIMKPKDDFYISHKYVGGILMESLPEWGHVTVDSSLIAHHEVRGWRSVLIGLIKAGVVPYSVAVKEFGDPYNDSRSKYWFEQLHRFLVH